MYGTTDDISAAATPSGRNCNSTMVVQAPSSIAAPDERLTPAVSVSSEFPHKPAVVGSLLAPPNGRTVTSGWRANLVGPYDHSIRRLDACANKCNGVPQCGLNVLALDANPSKIKMMRRQPREVEFPEYRSGSLVADSRRCSGNRDLAASECSAPHHWWLSRKTAARHILQRASYGHSLHRAYGQKKPRRMN